MKRSNLCALIVALLFFAGSSFIYNAATKDTNSTIQLALIDGSIASNIKYDRKKIWHNKDEIANNIDDDLNGFTDDIIGWNFRENNNVLFSPKAGEHGTSLMFLLNGKSKGYSSLLEGVNCSIMPVRILSENDGARLSDLIEAIKYAERMGADICNLTWIPANPH